MSQILESQLYRAGAGAGKTTTLIRMIEENAFKYFQEHGEFPRFIVTTFTRKATQELRERLLLRAIEKNDLNFLQFVNSSHHLLVSTIHGVLNVFLSRYGHQFDLDPSFQIINPTQERKIEFLILKDMLKERPELHELVDLFSLLRLAELFHGCSLKLSQFPNLKAFSHDELQTIFDGQLIELSEQIAGLAQDIKSETSKEDWNKYAQKIIEISVCFKNKNMAGAQEILKSNRKPSFNEKSEVSEEINNQAQALKKKIDNIFSLPYSPVLWERHEHLTKSFLQLAREFHDRCGNIKTKNGVLTTADLEFRTLQALRAQPESAQSFGAEWDYWYVDEYQDTSPLQEEMIQLLQAGRPTFVVGDPQQSIYLFRGARSEVFLRKEKDFNIKNYPIHKLVDNYRSRSELVCFFNEYFKKLGFQEMNSKSQIESPHMPVTFLKTQDSEQEYVGIANWIKKLLSDNVPAEDICVLSKTNDILKNIAQVLKQENIPYRLHSTGSFSKRREITDALALLKFLVNPHDNFNLLCLLRTPYFFVPDYDLESLRSQPGNLWETLRRENTKVFSELEKLRANSQNEGIFATFSQALLAHGFFEGANIYDKSGVAESNLFKLLHSLKSSLRKVNFNFLSFIDEMKQEGSEASESDAIPAVEPRRVNLMTIHRSKGLQFTHVIVPGFARGMRRNWKPILVDEEKEKIVLSIPELDASQEMLFVGQNISEKYFAREKEESHRLLYVAFTRARESLFTGVGGECETGSWLESCLLSLTEGEHDKGLFKYQVLHSIPEVELISNQLHIAQLKKINSKTEKSLPSVSVTELIAEKSHAVHSNVLQSLDKIRVGTELHNIFEKLASAYSGEEEDLLLKAIPEKYQEAVRFVFEQNQIPMREILKTGRAEFGFIQKTEKHILEGKIDLWGIADNTLWIVDYKTGSTNHRDKAFTQLQFYADPLMKMLKLNRAKLAVLFPLEKKFFVQEV